MDADLSAVRRAGKIVRIPMDVVERAVASGRLEDLDGTPVFSLVSGPDRTSALGAKRLLDIVGAAIGLAILAIVFAAVVVAVKLDDGGPVLFRQRRIGLHGRPFRVVKFRVDGYRC